MIMTVLAHCVRQIVNDSIYESQKTKYLLFGKHKLLTRTTDIQTRNLCECLRASHLRNRVLYLPDIVALYVMTNPLCINIVALCVMTITDSVSNANVGICKYFCLVQAA